MHSKTINLPIANLRAFVRNPYQVREDSEFLELVASIRELGVLVPAIVRPLESGEYELLSGHRRLAACKMLELETIPAIVRELDDNEAAIIVVDSNQQRKELLPSEIAFSAKLRYDAIKAQGKRNDLTSCQVVTRTDDLVAQVTNSSGRNMQRYIRLTNLCPPLLKFVDDKKIGVSAGVELSFLDDAEQLMLLSVVNKLQRYPTQAQSEKLKRHSKAYGLTIAVIENILAKREVKKAEKIEFSRDELQAYFPEDCSAEEIREHIFELIEKHPKRAD